MTEKISGFYGIIAQCSWQYGTVHLKIVKKQDFGCQRNKIPRIEKQIFQSAGHIPRIQVKVKSPIEILRIWVCISVDRVESIAQHQGKRKKKKEKQWKNEIYII